MELKLTNVIPAAPGVLAPAVQYVWALVCRTRPNTATVPVITLPMEAQIEEGGCCVFMA